MIPTTDLEAYETALGLLAKFGDQTQIRGRFVAMYLGLRRMYNDLPLLGDTKSIAASQIEGGLDELFRKCHLQEPLVVLTALFGQSTSPTAPYSTRTGDRSPANQYPTNTWRNNFGIQKGIGCPADPDTIRYLLHSDGLRLACPHVLADNEGRQKCGIQGTVYRGEEHSIWLRMMPNGYQVADLDEEAVYTPYLFARGQKIPIFPLIGAMYSFAPPEAYPERVVVGIPDFAEDFKFARDQVATLFDCEPANPYNAVFLGFIADRASARDDAVISNLAGADRIPNTVPDSASPFQTNPGTGAEIAVAHDLQRHGWRVGYRGNQRGFGYDLEAVREGATLRIEVKSSIGFCTPELLDSEWQAAQQYGEEFTLAIVDFVGSEQQTISYIRDPASMITPSIVPRNTYRLSRSEAILLGTTAEFL